MLSLFKVMMYINDEFAHSLQLVDYMLLFCGDLSRFRKNPGMATYQINPLHLFQCRWIYAKLFLKSPAEMAIAHKSNLASHLTDIVRTIL